MKAFVYEKETETQLATIQIDSRGRKLQNGRRLWRSGVVRPFRIEHGDLGEQWSLRRPMLMRTEDGREACVCVATMPMEEGSAGFLEFL